MRLPRLTVLVTLLTLATLTHAQTVEQILTKHAEALGGMDRIAQIKSVTMNGTLRVGEVDIAITELFSAPNKLRQEETFQDRTSLLVFDGQNGWNRDVNGRTQQQTGDELRGTITEVHAFSLRYVSDRSNWNRFKLLRTDRRTRNYVLQFSPEGGRPATMHISPKTHLITLVEIRSGGDNLRITQEDYRKVNGIPFAFKARISSGQRQFDQVLTVKTIELNKPIQAALFTKPEPILDYKWSGTDKHATAPLHFDGDHLFVDVKVNGKDTRMLVDTGAGSTVLTRKFANELGLKGRGRFEVRGGGGSTNARLINGVNFELQGISLSNQRVMELDAPILGSFPVPIGGVLGYDFFSRFVVKIDYIAKTLTVYDPAVAPKVEAGRTVAMELSDRTPVVTGKVDGIPLKLRVDTGSNSSASLAHTFVRKHNLKKRYPASRKSVSAGAGGLFTETVHRVHSFNLAGTEFKDRLLHFSDDETGVADEEVEGNVGNEFLSRFTLVLDYPGQKATFIPNENISKADEEYYIGIGLGERDGRVFIDFISPFSPAERAGIKPGDEVVTLNGTSTDGLSVSEVRALIDRTQRKEYTLQLRREGQTRTVRVTSALDLETPK